MLQFLTELHEVFMKWILLLPFTLLLNACSTDKIAYHQILAAPEVEKVNLVDSCPSYDVTTTTIKRY